MGYHEVIPVEDVQDIVESTLIENGFGEIAKSYMLGKHERRKVREDNVDNVDNRYKNPTVILSKSSNLRKLWIQRQKSI